MPVLAALAALLAVSPAVVAQPAGEAASGRIAADPGVAEALEVARVWLEAERDYDQIPGISAALVHDQELLWSGGYGEAHPERGVPATSETLYSICSISKLFTSIALMQQRDRGLVALSDPVREHLPWFALEETFPGAPAPTVEGILTHSAGLPREADAPYWSAPDFPFPTREEIIEGVSRQETLYPAWRYFQYSNLGLTLVGEIVRVSSGQPYDAYVRSAILDPLGLDDTYPDMPEEHAGGRLATGHTAMGRGGERQPTPFFRARGIAPAAGYASTVDDLARFASWQFRVSGEGPFEGDDVEVLHPHTLQEMQRVHYVDPDFDTYWGLGFGVYRRGGQTFVGHGGSCPGYRSQLVLDMDDRIAVVFMANASGVDTWKYASGLYDLVAPRVKKAAQARADDDGASTARAAVDTAADAEGRGAADAGAADAGAGDDASSDRAGGPDLDDYVGAFSTMPWGGELAVVRWDGGLALLGLPSSDPAEALRTLRHVEGDRFRAIRDDGEPGDPVEFRRDADGRVATLRIHTTVYPRIR